MFWFNTHHESDSISLTVNAPGTGHCFICSLISQMELHRQLHVESRPEEDKEPKMSLIESSLCQKKKSWNIWSISSPNLDLKSGKNRRKQEVLGIFFFERGGGHLSPKVNVRIVTKKWSFCEDQKCSQGPKIKNKRCIFFWKQGLPKGGEGPTFSSFFGGCRPLCFQYDTAIRIILLYWKCVLCSLARIFSSNWNWLFSSAKFSLWWNRLFVNELVAKQIWDVCTFLPSELPWGVWWVSGRCLGGVWGCLSHFWNFWGV